MPRLPPVTMVTLSVSRASMLSFLALAGDAEPAVDDQCMPGDHRGFWQAQQVYRAGDVLRREHGPGGGGPGEIRQKLFPVREKTQGNGIDDPCAGPVCADL